MASSSCALKLSMDCAVVGTVAADEGRPKISYQPPSARGALRPSTLDLAGEDELSDFYNCTDNTCDKSKVNINEAIAKTYCRPMTRVSWTGITSSIGNRRNRGIIYEWERSI